MLIQHSQADILASYLIAAGVGVNPAPALPITTWPIYIDSQPDIPDRLIVIYSRGGRLDGRSHKTGTVLTHPGIQVAIRVRAGDYRSGYLKGNNVASELDDILNNMVTLQSKTYKVAAVTRTSDVLSIGQDPRSRPMFTLNANTTIEMV